MSGASNFKDTGVATTKFITWDDRTDVNCCGLSWWTLLVIGSGALGPCCQDGKLTLRMAYEDEGWQTRWVYIVGVCPTPLVLLHFVVAATVLL
jgi:hypothetical protein